MKKTLLVLFAIAFALTAGATNKLTMKNAVKQMELPVFAVKSLEADNSLKARAQKARKGPRRVKPDALQDSYKANGKIYNSSSRSWVDTDEWTVTAGVENYDGEDYDVLYDIFPPTVFNNPVDFVYDVEGKYIICYADPITQYQDYLVYPMDLTDFQNGGTGDIVLVLGDDGSLEIPAENATHVYGYYACSYNPETYAPRSVAGAFQQCAFLTYEPTNVAPPADLSGITHEVTFETNADWVDAVSDEGWWQIWGINYDYTASISTLNSPLTAGTFTKDDLDLSYTYLKDLSTGKKVKAADVNATLDVDAETNVVTGVMEIQDYNTGDIWKVTLVHNPAKPIYLQYDAIEQDYEATFKSSEVEMQSGQTDGGINFVYVEGANADDQSMALLFVVSEPDAETILPEGEYAINDTAEAGTMLASVGLDDDGYLSESYAGNLEEGDLAVPVWFMVDGTVSVKKVDVEGGKALSIEINAINSGDSKVKIVVEPDAAATAISNAKTENAAKNGKFIRDNKVVILRNGVKYNVMGVEMK